MRFTDHYSLRVMDADDYYNVDDFNKNTESIDTLLYNLNYKVDNLQPGGSGSSAIYEEVTLLASGWDVNDNTQSVNIEGVTTSSIVVIGLPMNATLEQINAIASAKINVTEVANGSITFKVMDTKPLIDVPISITIL